MSDYLQPNSYTSAALGIRGRHAPVPIQEQVRSMHMTNELIPGTRRLDIRHLVDGSMLTRQPYTIPQLQEFARTRLYVLACYTKPWVQAELEDVRDNHPSPEWRREAQLAMSREELIRYRKDLIGTVIMIEHRCSAFEDPTELYSMSSGVVTHVLQADDGSTLVGVRFFDDADGVHAVRMIEHGLMLGASLQFRRIPIDNGRSSIIVFREISLCRHGRRPGTGLVGICEFTRRPPPLRAKSIRYTHPHLETVLDVIPHDKLTFQQLSLCAPIVNRQLESINSDGVHESLQEQAAKDAAFSLAMDERKVTEPSVWTSACSAPPVVGNDTNNKNSNVPNMTTRNQSEDALAKKKAPEKTSTDMGPFSLFGSVSSSRSISSTDSFSTIPVSTRSKADTVPRSISSSSPSSPSASLAMSTSPAAAAAAAATTPNLTTAKAPAPVATPATAAATKPLVSVNSGDVSVAATSAPVDASVPAPAASCVGDACKAPAAAPADAASAGAVAAKQTDGPDATMSDAAVPVSGAADAAATTVASSSTAGTEGLSLDSVNTPGSSVLSVLNAFKSMTDDEKARFIVDAAAQLNLPIAPEETDAGVVVDNAAAPSETTDAAATMLDAAANGAVAEEAATLEASAAAVAAAAAAAAASVATNEIPTDANADVSMDAAPAQEEKSAAKETVAAAGAEAVSATIPSLQALLKNVEQLSEAQTTKMSAAERNRVDLMKALAEHLKQVQAEKQAAETAKKAAEEAALQVSVNSQRLERELNETKKACDMYLEGSNKHYMQLAGELVQTIGTLAGVDVSNNVLQISKHPDVGAMDFRTFFAAGDFPRIISTCTARVNQLVNSSSAETWGAATTATAPAVAPGAADFANKQNKTIESLMPTGAKGLVASKTAPAPAAAPLTSTNSSTGTTHSKASSSVPRTSEAMRSMMALQKHFSSTIPSVASMPLRMNQHPVASTAPAAQLASVNSSGNTSGVKRSAPSAASTTTASSDFGSDMARRFASSKSSAPVSQGVLYSQDEQERMRATESALKRARLSVR
jgi:hypothetical protein